VLCAASFLLFMALLLPLVVAPRLARAPLAPYEVVVAQGRGAYRSASTGATVDSAALQHTTTVRGAPEDGSAAVAVVDTFATLEDLTPGLPDADRVLSAVEERIALDRRTGAAVACCGEDPAHQGLTLRFPFGTQQRDYDLWDPHVAAARPATFVRTDEVDGLEVYVFTQRIEPTEVGRQQVPVDLGPPGEASIVHAADKELWVEPRTGRIVRALADVTRTLERDGGTLATLASLSLGWNADTVGRQVAGAGAEAARLERVSRALPIAALALGAPLLAWGVVLTGRAARREPGGSAPPSSW
jgi:hypothetical protein